MNYPLPTLQVTNCNVDEQVTAHTSKVFRQLLKVRILEFTYEHLDAGEGVFWEVLEGLKRTRMRRFKLWQRCLDGWPPLYGDYLKDVLEGAYAEALQDALTELRGELGTFFDAAKPFTLDYEDVFDVEDFLVAREDLN